MNGLLRPSVTTVGATLVSIDEVITAAPTTRGTATTLIPLIATRTIRLGPYFICNTETRRAYANA